MACYDCEHCSLHYQQGGKCTRWEYDCPFTFLREITQEDFSRIEQLKEYTNKALELTKQLQNNTIYSTYEQIEWTLENAIYRVDNLLDKGILEEWERINGKGNK